VKVAQGSLQDWQVKHSSNYFKGDNSREILSSVGLVYPV